MQTLIGIIALAISSAAVASEVPDNLMSTAKVTCRDYLSLPANSAEALRLDYWAAGRIVAIAPASFQDKLAKIPFKTMQSDLRDFCMENQNDSGIFEGSALLIFYYQRNAASEP